MNIVDVSTKKIYAIQISRIDEADLATISCERYFFDWKKEKSYEVLKLTIVNERDILGLVSFESIDEEKRMHIRLLAASQENVGKDKIYDGIVGNLLAYVAQQAVLKYAEWACISLRPKTQLAEHYIKKYKMNITGVTLSLEVPEILELIERYRYEEERKND